MKKFKNVISLGAFCFVAMELRRLGIRKKAYPFDWIITDIKTTIELIEKGFEDFSNDKFLEKKEINGILCYDNTKFSLIRFIHDFDENLSNTIEIQQKYKRRIERFYEDIKSPTLFIRYIINSAEYSYILKNYSKISKLIKSYNTNNKIIFVMNSDIKMKYFKNMLTGIKIYRVEKDENDNVAKELLNKNAILLNYIRRLIDA